jgi:hypothetical protein
MKKIRYLTAVRFVPPALHRHEAMATASATIAKSLSSGRSANNSFKADGFAAA